MSFSSNFPTIAPSLNLDFANTKALDPRVTFTRASTATFYDGVTVAKAEENLLLQSQTFDNASWAITNSTITANSIAAPDGTTTAETLTASATPARGASQNPSVSSLAYTISIFAKAGTLNFVFIREYITNNAEKVTYFDLSLGTVGTTAAGHTASISSLGGGWYRCIVTCTPDAARSQLVQFGGCDANGSLTVTIGGTIYLWGAQLEQRSAVTAYTVTTTTQPITNYIPVLRTAAAGVARFNHNPTTGESQGLLIEEQRANLLTYSDDFANAAWTNESTSEESNVIIAPDGTLTGDKLVENTANDNHRIFQSVTKAASAITYAYTLFVKGGVNRNVRLSFDSGLVANNVQAGFNLTTGTVSVAATSGGTFSGASASIQSVGNGWYRCTVIGTTGTETTVRGNAWILNGTTPNYTGDGYSGIYIWGAQLEAGAFATSYIPTVAASVTRAADSASMTGTNFSSWYRADEGTAYVEAIPSTQALTQLLVDFNDGGSNNRWRIFRADITGACSFSVNALGSAQVSAITSGTFTQNATTKAAATYKTNDFALSGNAATVATDTSGNVPVVNVLRIAAQFDGAGVLNGTIKKIAYYPLRLTNAQLQALTS